MSISVTNPLSSQHSVLRRHLAGSLLDVLALNERQGREDVAIYEIGKGYGRVGESPREWTRLALLLTGGAAPPAWNRPARAWDLDDAMHTWGRHGTATTRGYGAARSERPWRSRFSPVKASSAASARR